MTRTELQEALARILAAVPSPAREEVVVGEAARRVAAGGFGEPVETQRLGTAQAQESGNRSARTSAFISAD
jgi:hypothetical protein